MNGFLLALVRYLCAAYGAAQILFFTSPSRFFSTKLKYNGGVLGSVLELLGVVGGRNFRVIPRSI